MLAIPEAEIRKGIIQSQFRQKVNETPISTNKLVVVAPPVTPAMWEV
jgi:hypothetical protein